MSTDLDDVSVGASRNFSREPNPQEKLFGMRLDLHLGKIFATVWKPRKGNGFFLDGCFTLGFTLGIKLMTFFSLLFNFDCLGRVGCVLFLFLTGSIVSRRPFLWIIGGHLEEA